MQAYVLHFIFILWTFWRSDTAQGRPFISHKSDQSGPLLEFVITLVACGLHNVVTVYSCEARPRQHFSPSSHPADQFEVEETVCHQPITYNLISIIKQMLQKIAEFSHQNPEFSVTKWTQNSKVTQNSVTVLDVDILSKINWSKIRFPIIFNKYSDF